MCKHILNAQVIGQLMEKNFHFCWINNIRLPFFGTNYLLQVYICSPCCGKWYECAECHDENVLLHHFKTSTKLRLTCKVCKNCFNRDLQIFSQRDKHCDFCGNLWVLPGVTPESSAFRECQSVIDTAMETLIDPKEEYFMKVE